MVPPSVFPELVPWAEESFNAVNCIAFSGITIGFTPTTYEPTRPTSRGEATLFLSRLVDQLDPLPDPDGTPAGNWTGEVASAANQLAQLGIIDRDSFAGHSHRSPMTRSEVAPLAHRILVHLGVSLPSTSESRFADIAGEPEQTMEAIEQLAAAGVMIGVADTTFDPDAPVTRGQMALILTRILAVVDNRVTPGT